jgi:hypothetical protein
MHLLAIPKQLRLSVCLSVCNNDAKINPLREVVTVRIST